MTAHDTKSGEWRLMDWIEAKMIMIKLRNVLNNFANGNFTLYKGVCDYRIGPTRSAGCDGNGRSFLYTLKYPFPAGEIDTVRSILPEYAELLNVTKIGVTASRKSRFVQIRYATGLETMHFKYVRMTNAGVLEDWIKIEFDQFMKIGPNYIHEFVSERVERSLLEIRILVEGKRQDLIPLDGRFRSCIMDTPPSMRVESILLVLAIHIGLLQPDGVSNFLQGKTLRYVRDLVLWRDLSFCQAHPSMQMRYLTVPSFSARREGGDLGLYNHCMGNLLRLLEVDDFQTARSKLFQRDIS
eukprot:CCRYP_020754-RA/>CCRYP_020754-RA protein AED:0.40 eAED:0.98 QI:0/0/0/1/1/1/2/0/296